MVSPENAHDVATETRRPFAWMKTLRIETLGDLVEGQSRSAEFTEAFPQAVIVDHLAVAVYRPEQLMLAREATSPLDRYPHAVRIALHVHHDLLHEVAQDPLPIHSCCGRRLPQCRQMGSQG